MAKPDLLSNIETGAEVAAIVLAILRNIKSGDISVDEAIAAAEKNTNQAATENEQLRQIGHTE